MRGFHRKTTPKVIAGKAQRKNRHGLTPHYSNTPQEQPAIDRRRPGDGYRHVLKKSDVQRFVSILPEWRQLSVGLNAIVLASGGNCYGWHRPGIVAVCAWDICLHEEWPEAFLDDHRGLLDRMGVPIEPLDDGCHLCKFSPATVRAFQLVHILMHELGHHCDRMTTKSKRRASRGERFAEDYAVKYESQIWDKYIAEFGMP